MEEGGHKKEGYDYIVQVANTIGVQPYEIKKFSKLVMEAMNPTEGW